MAQPHRLLEPLAASLRTRFPLVPTDDRRFNCKNRILSYTGASEADFRSLCAALEAEGLSREAERTLGENRYVELRGGDLSAFVNFYGATGELRAALEAEETRFFFRSEPDAAAAAPLITQLALADFGQGHVVRLSDGRFILIDAGDDFPENADRLYNCLCRESGEKKPCIAAWFFTHPHRDHYSAFFPFMETYGDKVTVEAVLFSFPDADDTEHFPHLLGNGRRMTGEDHTVVIPQLYALLKSRGIPVLTPHTGQVYRIGDAVCEVLFSPDDALPTAKKKNFNALSLVIRMELAGQVILWTGDAQFDVYPIQQRYGDHLRADILQVPHHGFTGGAAENYEVIRPDVCLISTFRDDAFVTNLPYRDSNRALYGLACVKEFIVGEPERTIRLPYAPPDGARAEFERELQNGRASAGANVWVFSDLNTSRSADCVFTLTNMTAINTEVKLDLFFENEKQRIRFLAVKVSRFGIRKIDLRKKDDFEPESLPFNPFSYETQGLPKRAAFTVRFTASAPVIVSNRVHPAQYSHTNR